MSKENRAIFKQLATTYCPEMTDKEFEMYYDHAEDVVHTLSLTLKLFFDSVPANWRTKSYDAHMTFAVGICQMFPDFMQTFRNAMPGKSDNYVMARAFAVINPDFEAKMLMSAYAVAVQREDACKLLAENAAKNLCDETLTADLYFDEGVRSFLTECQVPKEQWLDTLYEVFGSTPSSEITNYVEYLKEYRKELL